MRVLALNLFLIAVVITCAALMLQLDHIWFEPLPKGFEIAAWPLFITGSLLILSAAYTLLKNSGSTGAPGDPTRTLVTDGLYGWMRNPIYAGDALLLFGLAFFTWSIMLFLAAILYLPCIDLFVRMVEEPRKEKRFGEDYIKYKQSVPRWTPRVSKLVGL